MQDQPSQQLPAITTPSVPAKANRGGLGRVPTRVRRQAREGFARLIPRFIGIAEGEKVKQTVSVATPMGQVITSEQDVIPAIKDQVKAFDLLGKYGFGENINPDDVRTRLQIQCRAILEECGTELGERLIARLAKVWTA